MENHWNSYYCQQAGNGYAVYIGLKYQRGNGFFGKIFKKLRPALKYLGKEGLQTLSNIGREIIDGDNLEETAKKHISRTGKRIASTMLDKADEYLSQQKGS